MVATNGDVIFKLCAQEFMVEQKEKSLESTQLVERVSIDSNVLSKHTAMLGRLLLTEE